MARVTIQTKAMTRRRLLETAAEHFAEQGLDRASIDAIAAAAGCAKGTFYNYFESKERAFFEVIAEGARRAAARYAEVSNRGSARERLAALAAADVSVLREDEAFAKVAVREAMSFRQETYAAIIDHLAPYLEKVKAVIDDGVAAGEIRDDVPAIQLALLFVGTLTLHYVQHWGSGGVWPALDDVPGLVLSSYLDGAAPREGKAGHSTR